MIISASRRTDIPAFYSEWFMRRIRAGFCTVANPVRKAQVSHVSLRPEDVDAIVFWTRNPAPLIKHLGELDERGYRYYFQYTIMDNPRVLDPSCPAMEESLKTARALADRIGMERIIWRYDPIVFANRLDADFHKKTYEHIARAMRDRTQRSVISIVDIYRKIEKRLDALTEEGFEVLRCSAAEPLRQAQGGQKLCPPGGHSAHPDTMPRLRSDPAEIVVQAACPAKLVERSRVPPAQTAGWKPASQYANGHSHVTEALYPDDAVLTDLMRSIAGTAKENGMEIFSCAEEIDFSSYGIRPGKCIDDAYICRVFGLKVSSAKDPSQRNACGCVTSRDIGAYDTCLFGCRYCYATSSFERARANHDAHDPASESLLTVSE
jgi:DNA repair photolyase